MGSWRFPIKTITATLFWFLFLVNTSHADSQVDEAATRDFVKAEEMIANQKWRRASGFIERLLKENRDLTESDRDALIVLLAKSLREQGKSTEAIDALEGMVVGRSPDYYLELGECLLQTKEHEKALNAGRAVMGDKGSLLSHQGTYLQARAHFGLEKYKKTMEECQTIMSGRIKKGHSLSDDEIDETAVAALGDLRKKAKELYEEARTLFEVREYGEDYSFYRQARELEFAGDYGEAIKIYSKIKGGALKMAATCYMGHCHAKRGEIREALKCYERLYENDADLYQGEALLNAAMLTCLHGSRSSRERDALKLTEKLVNWLAKIKLFDKTIELEGINDKLKTDVIATAPRAFLRSDDCGNLIRTTRYPGSIENRLSSPWYLPRLETKTELLNGYLLGESGDTDKAAEAFKKATSGDKPIKMFKKRYETLGLLLSGLANGVYLFPKEAAKKISTRHRAQLNMAAFHYAIEDYERAEEMFDAELKDKNKSKSYDRAAALLGKSFCLITRRRAAEAEPYLRRLRNNSVYKNLDAGRLGWYLSACQWLRDKKQRKKGLAVLEELGEDRRSELGARALLALATRLVNDGETERALDVCDDLRRKHSGTTYADAAKTLRASLKIKLKEKKRGKGKEKDAVEETGCLLPPVKEKTGEVIHHKRTIISPGTSNWQVNETTFEPGDWLVYKLTIVPRNECSIVRAVKITLDSEEPQIDEEKGNTIEFVRAPLLFVSGLRNNLKEKFPEIYAEAEDESE